jgi:hypothetical protein
MLSFCQYVSKCVMKNSSLSLHSSHSFVKHGEELPHSHEIGSKSEVHVYGYIFACRDAQN